MRRLFVALTLMAAVAFAGETYLGTTEVCAPAHCSNFYSDAGGFRVPNGQKLTVWCTVAAQVSVSESCWASLHTDGGVSDGGPGLPVEARTLFPTSTTTLACRLTLDGGSAWGVNGSNIVKSAGGTYGVCHWFTRLGTE